jgi:hypothetical protein
MGGFVLHDDNEPPRTLSLEDIERLVENDEISFPIIAREDIRDKSKGDAVTKGLALIQTTWFLLQCVARRVQHLSITELELVTAAFALLNVITYALWWDKPLDVKRPVLVHRKHIFSKEGEGQVGSSEKEVDEKDNQETSKAAGEGTKENGTTSHLTVWGVFARVFLTLIDPFGFMVSDDEDDDTFFAGKNEDDHQAMKARFSALGVAMIFGAIHCIAWSFRFPSHTELTLWRIFSVAITGIPPVVVMAVLLGYAYEDLPNLVVKLFVGVLAIVLAALLPILYVLARVALIILALMALRSLPPSAYQTVHWTTFLPHV